MNRLDEWKDKDRELIKLDILKNRRKYKIDFPLLNKNPFDLSLAELKTACLKSQYMGISDINNEQWSIFIDWFAKKHDTEREQILQRREDLLSHMFTHCTYFEDRIVFEEIVRKYEPLHKCKCKKTIYFKFYKSGITYGS